MLAFPPALRPGDLVAVVAPSGPLPHDAFLAGLAWVRDRYAVRMVTTVFDRKGYLAGDDARRAGELGRALADPSVKAIIAGRGGYGAMRLLGQVDLGCLARAPRWIVGFSDITALHVEASRVGVASIHGPNVTGLRRLSPVGRAAWLAALERPHAEASWQRLEIVHGAQGKVARGQACGGNLALVSAMAAAGRDVVPRSGVLFLEDIGEAPYRVDRMLTSLDLGGHLARASAIVFGGLSHAGPGPDGVTAREVLEDCTRHLGVPVLAGAPFGHEEDNRAFIVGRTAMIDGHSVIFPAV